jgi:hypothetical protein
MNIVSAQIVPYCAIIDAIGRQHDPTNTASVRDAYGIIMNNWVKQQIPPDSPAIYDGRLLSAAKKHVYSRVLSPTPELVGTGVSNNIMFTEDDIADAADMILGEAATSIRSFFNMTESHLVLPIRNVIQWLKASVLNDDIKDLNAHILALAFLSRLCALQEQVQKTNIVSLNADYRTHMVEHGIAEVLVMGIACHNQRAFVYQSTWNENGKIVTQTQLAYYTLMAALLRAPDITPLVLDLAKFNSIQTVMKTLVLSMSDNPTLFSFLRQGQPYRPIVCQTEVQGLEKAPYVTRCNGVTPTYNIPELATVVACHLCFGNTCTRQITHSHPIFLQNWNTLETIQLRSNLNLMSLLKVALYSFSDTDPELSQLHHEHSMGMESFHMRAVSRGTVQNTIFNLQHFYSARPS